MSDDANIQKSEMLIAILLDKTARLDERDDAAMDLAGFDNERVITALVAVGSDSSEDALLQASCGETLAEIWVRLEHFDPTVLQRLSPVARSEFSGTLASHQSRVLQSHEQ